MPPYYPPLAPFFPGFRRGLLNFQRLALLLHPGADCLQDIPLQALPSGSSRRADRCALILVRLNFYFI